MDAVLFLTSAMKATQYDQFKQQHVCASYLDISPFYKDLEEDPNGHPQIGRKWLGCTGMTQ